MAYYFGFSKYQNKMLLENLFPSPQPPPVALYSSICSRSNAPKLLQIDSTRQIEIKSTAQLTPNETDRVHICVKVKAPNYRWAPFQL